MFASGSGSGPGRSQLVNASSDPVVVGLGRLLVLIGAVALAGMLAVALVLLALRIFGAV